MLIGGSLLYGSDGREVAGGGEGLIAGGGPVFPGAGWAYVTVME